jgi:hypothetical protein
MGPFAKIGIIAAIGIGGGAMAGLIGNARDDRAAEDVWHKLRTSDPAPPVLYHPDMVAELPEIGRRYFAAAIAPGTPLHRIAEFKMEGTFIMNGRHFNMQADQILAPDHGFVWRASMRSGALRFAGSDGYESGSGSWTRFWLAGLVPLARIGGSEDHRRAAAARMMMETIWAPATLLPQYGAVWRQLAPDQAEISFPSVVGIQPVIFTLDEHGHIREATTMRWTDANPEKVYRHQPFGGRMLDHETIQGFTIPSEVEIGNMFGTAQYVPFFHARLSDGRFFSSVSTENSQ